LLWPIEVGRVRQGIAREAERKIVSDITLAQGTASRPLAELAGAGITVPLVQGGQARYVNLDYAASAPSLAQVVARVADVLPWYASVHRGSGYLSLVSTALYESARATVRQFVGARDDDVVIFTRNTTDGLNLLVQAVPSHTPVVYLDIEHHADILPWQRHLNHCVRAAATWAETAQRLEQALEEHPGALLAITGASNVTGELVPLPAVVAMAHERGARVVVDAAQLAPHRPIDLSQMGADFIAFSGHKCYAPFGVGVLVGRRDWLDESPAYLAGGGAVESVTIERTDWARSPERHEGGTPNFVGAVALAEASLVLTELFASGAVEAHEKVLRRRLLAGLGPLEGVRALQIWPDAAEAVGIVAFEVQGHEAGLVAACLSGEYGVGVRDGKFCAHPLLARLNYGQGALRASFGLGTTIDDIDRLIAALTQYLQHGPRHSYSRHERWFIPDGDDRLPPFPELDLADPRLSPPSVSRRARPL
jgi:selenocysteine lyase/cysteine desulfurase